MSIRLRQVAQCVSGPLMAGIRDSLGVLLRDNLIPLVVDPTELESRIVVCIS